MTRNERSIAEQSTLISGHAPNSDGLPVVDFSARSAEFRKARKKMFAIERVNGENKETKVPASSMVAAYEV